MSDTNTHIVNISGGRTSGFLAYLMEQKRKAEGFDVEYIFCDTGAEHPETYVFLKNIVSYLKINITCLRAKVNPEHGKGTSYEVVGLDECKQDLKPFLEVCKKYSTPSYTFGHCTREMKSTPAKKYCNEKYGSDWVNWLGIRVDEPRRLALVDNQIDMFAEKKKVDRSRANIKYLAHISDFTKQDILDFWSHMPFDLELEEHLGNCVFCVKKGINKVALAARDEPEMAVRFIGMIADDAITARPGSPLGKEIMYRGLNSLQSVIDHYKDHSREDIANTIRGMKQLEAGACSESCEAMDVIPDLFDEAV